jgi:hypothetical protein
MMFAHVFGADRCNHFGIALCTANSTGSISRIDHEEHSMLAAPKVRLPRRSETRCEVGHRRRPTSRNVYAIRTNTAPIIFFHSALGSVYTLAGFAPGGPTYMTVEPLRIYRGCWSRDHSPLHRGHRGSAHEVPSVVTVNNSLIVMNCRARSAILTRLSRRGASSSGTSSFLHSIYVRCASAVPQSPRE